MMLTRTFLMLCARWLAASAMSGGLLWAIATQLDPETAEVVVHVWDVPSIVTIDGTSHQRNSLHDQPITLVLRGGWHDLTLWRDGVVAFQDRFHVTPGSDLSFGIYARSPRSVTLPPPRDEAPKPRCHKPALIDAADGPPARFRYVPSRGQGLLPLGLFDSVPLGSATRLLDRLEPTTDHMLLYSVGPDGVDDWALTNIDPRGKGDIVYPIRDNAPPPE